MLYFFQVFINYIVGKVKHNAIAPAVIGMIILAFYAGTMQPNYSFDTLAYQNYYNQINSHLNLMFDNRFELGFKYLNMLGGIIGLDYESFRLFSFLIFFLIFLWALLRFNTNISKFIAAYSIVPFFSDVTQVRNFFMMALVLLAYSFMQKINMKNYIIATFLILLGSSIHSMGYLFLIGLPFFKIPFNRIKNMLLVIIPISITVFIIIKTINSTFVIKVVQVLTENSGRDIFDTSAITSGIGITQAIQYLVMSVLMALTVYLIMNNGIENSNQKSLLILFFVEFISFPFIVISVTSFSRLIRAAFVTMLIINSSKIEVTSKKNEATLIVNSLFFVAYLLAIFTFDGGIVGNSQFSEYIPYILHFKNY